MKPRCSAVIGYRAGASGEEAVLCGQTVAVSKVWAPDGSLSWACRMDGHRGQVERRLARTRPRVVV